MIDFRLDVDGGIVTGIHDTDEKGKIFSGRLFVPKNVVSFDEEALIGLSPAAIEVEEGNTVFYAENNCLIRKADKALYMACPASVIPAAVERIERCAFNISEDMSGMDLNPLVIPDSVKEIGYRAFALTSRKAVHIVIPGSVETIGCMAFMIRSEKEPVTVEFKGSPVLETGVFGTKAECMGSDFELVKQLPDMVYTLPESFQIRCNKGSSAEEYCRKYRIPYMF